MAVTGKYITQNDVDNWPEDVTQTEMQEIIDRVEQTVERVTGDFFCVKTFHKFFDGNKKAQIFPNLFGKILSINKMVISDTEISKTDFTGSNISGSSGSYDVTLVQASIAANYYENNYMGIYDVSEVTNFYWGSRIISHTATSSGNVVYTLNETLPTTLTSGDTVSIIYNWDHNENSIYRNPVLTHHEPGTLMEPYEFFSYDVFPRGKRNVEVWGSYGWRSCPLNVKKSCIILCRAENDETLYSRQGYGMESERLGDYAYKKAKMTGNMADYTGINEVDQLLSGYIIKKPKLGVA